MRAISWERDPGVSLEMTPRGGPAPYRPQAGSTLQAGQADQVGACLRAFSWERDRTVGLRMTPEGGRAPHRPQAGSYLQAGEADVPTTQNRTIPPGNHRRWLCRQTASEPQPRPKRKPIGVRYRATTKNRSLGKNHHFISGNVPHHAALSGLKS